MSYKEVKSTISTALLSLQNTFQHHFIRECVESGKIKPVWISGKENPADLLTKSLPRVTLEKYIDKLKLERPDNTNTRLIVHKAYFETLECDPIGTATWPTMANLMDTEQDVKYMPEVLDSTLERINIADAFLQAHIDDVVFSYNTDLGIIPWRGDCTHDSSINKDVKEFDRWNKTFLAYESEQASEGAKDNEALRDTNTRHSSLILGAYAATLSIPNTSFPIMKEPKDMNVIELRQELSNRNQKVSGLKADLVKRLEESIARRIALDRIPFRLIYCGSCRG